MRKDRILDQLDESMCTPRTQEPHIMLGHIISGPVDDALFGRQENR